MSPPDPAGHDPGRHPHRHTGGDWDDDVDLDHHGDRDLADGLVDLAVNVRRPTPPRWLIERIVADSTRWAAYPDATAATTAIAAAHGVDHDCVLPTSGAAEAFTLLARALRCRFPVVVHPQFTEPEVALRLAGHSVHRVVLSAADGFALDPDAVPEWADLVVLGNPTNPTSVLHPADTVRRLARPGRVLVVDEAFMDTVPDEPASLIGPDLAGLLVTRSLTKTWGIAGIRAGYLVGDPDLVARAARQQPPWSVSTPALSATIACLDEPARTLAARQARRDASQRDYLAYRLAEANVPIVRPPSAPFVLAHTARLGPGSVRPELARRGFAVRRGETFPGLDETWVRVAARTEAVTDAFVAALTGLGPLGQ